MAYRSHLSCARGGCWGFTLIELLLVIVIIAVVTAVSVPSFVKSMRGNRRRTAARTVVAAGRYARSMAVLHQRPMAITFNLDDASLLVAEYGGTVAADEDAEEDTAEEEAEADPLSAAFEADRDERHEAMGAGAGAGVSAPLERKLDQVTISHVTVDGEAANLEGSCDVVYQSNGRCIPYEVRIVDGQEEGIVIKVDALASALILGDE
ncbi:MAG: prepilin-type N-terminal cleavage/methylation domain-containing protein [Verrucomicrobia bacterium]|jgi:prepilin-type N-terminal cleavage/methylation domain-containing protein|nr:prepilin-type N-terminal cleavage/methylation domain-containing protein [Verrucomicrobiota bacterium]